MWSFISRERGHSSRYIALKMASFWSLAFTLVAVGLGFCHGKLCIPDCSEMREGDKVPDPTNCFRYYYCSDPEGTGELIHSSEPLDCPEGYYFNAELHILECEPIVPENMHCTALCNPCEVKCTTPGTLIPNVNDCGMYKICLDDGSSIGDYCPSNLPYFDYAAGLCSQDPGTCYNLCDPCDLYCTHEGLFTLLLEDMGVRGVQVEEIYDLQKSFEGKVFGFIFLFRWIEERRSRRKIVENTDNYVQDENIVNTMFFAQQMVPNSCATHSLVSVLLNCSTLDLGPTLSRLKVHTIGMDPENKGWAIGNTPELANAHNSHAAPQARRRPDKTPGVPTSSRTSNAETFHFVSYVPVNGRLFELDGLKPFPIDHGPWLEGEDWTEKFRRVITERLGIATGGEPYHDIRFNLMAVVPDKITAYRRKLMSLRRNRETILEALHHFVRQQYPAYIGKEKPATSNPTKTEDEIEEGNNLSLLAVAASQKLEAQGYADESATDDQEMAQESRIHHAAFKKEHTAVPLGMPSAGSISTPPDYATPLTIETSPEPPSTPSTDTASEAGSDFNSPQGSPSANCEYQHLVVVRLAPSTPTIPLAPPAADATLPVAPDSNPGTTSTDPTGGLVETEDNADIDETNVGSSLLQQVVAKRLQFEDGMFDHSPIDEDAESLLADHPNDTTTFAEGLDSCSSDVSSVRNYESSSFGSEFSLKQEGSELKTELDCDDEEKPLDKSSWDLEVLNSLEDGSTSPVDLLSLIKILGKEISTCESLLKDELEKRKRYKIDDSRRTHNYDQFIITFLAMLAEQGKIGDLVKQQMQPSRKRPAPTPATPRGSRPPLKKTESKSSPNSRKRGRKKKAKGKRKR